MSDAQRIALVTGASRGIGAATAVALAREGLHVVIVARTQGGLEATDDAIRAVGGTATLVPLDLTDGKSVDSIGPSLFQRFGRLDVLVSNAAVLGKLTPAPHIFDKDWDEVVGINLTATLRIIRTCSPLLLRAEAGRAVFVTSGIVRNPTAYWGMYGATKAAAEHLALSWAEETRRTPLRVNLFAPGIVATKLRATAMPGEDPATLAQPDDVAPALVRLCSVEETRHGEIITVLSA